MHQRLLSASLVGMCLSAGCGADAEERPDFTIAASATWSTRPASADDIGYTIAVLLLQRPNGAICREAPPSTRLTVDDQDVPLVRDPATRCLEGNFLSRPMLQNRAVLARIEEGGRLVGEVTFDGLMPGTAATLAFPADGRVRAGDELVFVPPPALPTSFPSRALFFPLEGPQWIAEGIPAPEPRERRLDGLHIGVPAFTGRALLVMPGMPSYLPPVVSCPGFATCTEIIETTLGPLFVTGEP